MGRILKQQDVEFAVLGGAIYAAGGKVWRDHGRKLGLAAINAGRPELVAIEELSPDAYVATATIVGQGNNGAWEVLGVDFLTAIRLLQEALGDKITGLIAGHSGSANLLNGWLSAAVMGSKVVDAVSVLRPYPNGDSWVLGQQDPGQQLIQTAVGGNRANHRYLELVVRGANPRIAPILRSAAEMSGGFIASCHNPLRASLVRQHAALGTISGAITLGESISQAQKRGVNAIIDAVCRLARGELLAQGRIARTALKRDRQGTLTGSVTLQPGQGPALLLHVYQEVLAVETADGERLAGFPDVITLLDKQGEAVSVEELQEGEGISLLRIARQHLPVQSASYPESLFWPAEEALGIKLQPYALAG